MHKPESVQVNETHKILWDLEIQTDYLILARLSDIGIINKRREYAMSWILPFRFYKYLNLAKVLKKAVKHEGDGDSNCSWCA